MSRSVPFDKTAICDECGCTGAFDFMGDYYCGDCSSKLINQQKTEKMFTLKIDDGICKGFKDEDGLDFFVNKAYDDEVKTHCLLVYIPKVPEFNILHLQQPLCYDSEQQRDEVYRDHINEEFVNSFWENVTNKIREDKAKLKQDEN